MLFSLKKWIPYLVFFTIYSVTSLIGTILLIFGPDIYWKLTYAFTGQTLPEIYLKDLTVIIGLIVGSIFALTLGYLVSIIISVSFKDKEIFSLPRKNFIGLLSNVVLFGLVMYSFIKIFMVIDLADISGWLYYNNFIALRKILMNNLSFLDFIIIYNLVPLFIAISLPNDMKNRRFIFLSMKILILIFMNIYIFQKRPLVNGLLLLCFTIFVYFYIGRKYIFRISKKLIRTVSFFCIIFYLIYAIGIYVNTIGEYDQINIVATEKVDLSKIGDKETKEEKDTNLFRSYSLEAQTLNVPKFVYTNTMALFGLVNRTAFSAICYPIVFPEFVDYYPIDLGQDILGHGTMPDDANLVWNILNPTAKGEGSIAAPFFIVLYSQGGLLVAILGSFIVGFLLGFFWNIILKSRKNNGVSSAFGALILLLAVLLAMASGRDSLLASYGLLFPLVCLLIFYIINFFLSRQNYKPQIVMLVTSGVVNDSRVLREARFAAENGFSVQVIGRKIPELGEIDNSLPFAIKLIPIKRAADSGVLGKIIERIRIGIAFTVNAIKYNPDIIHANDFDTLPFGYMAAKICGSMLVYDSHELWSENDLVASKNISKKMVKSIEKFLTHRCNRVISVSNACAAWLRESYKLQNITVVTNCPYSYTGDILPKNEGFELLCHGMFAADRGYEELIGSAVIVGAEGITIAIRGFGEKSEYYKQLAISTGQKNITFLPKVSPFEVVKAASTSHVGVILTRPVSINFKLTVSNKLFECINAGLPVILSDIPEHRYLNEKYEFGIILKEITSECLAEAVIKLKNDKNLYNALKQNAIKAARELCWENEGLKLITVYKNILNEEENENEADTIKKGNYINI